MDARATLAQAKRMLEWGQGRMYKRACARVDTNFEEWMERRIAQRERENRRLASARDTEESAFVLFAAADGAATKDACRLIRQEFAAHPELVLVYGDEDVPRKSRREGEAYEPWLKPMWSPAFFSSCFYFGNFFAIRREVYENWARDNETAAGQVMRINGAEEENAAFLEEEMRCRYRMCYEILLRNGAFERHGAEKVGHIPEILFHDGASSDIRRIFDVGALKFQGIELQPPGQAADLVSVVIPSKDHPDVLERCISSIREETELEGTGISLEILVVDNGSSDGNRARLERMALKYDFIYCYEPMEFNFSRMCNAGVARSRGNYILLLNDDMEIIQSNWLEELLKRARMPYAGAVGAKLLYPGTTLIQHAGITNIRLGPTHKLQRQDDMRTYYFGQNRMVHDMLAVTGACLLVRRKLYQEAQGLAEELRVAFNDVDFCFKLHELGYSNIQCNDVLLYHHESLSRGNDLEDEGKAKRLEAEKKRLFALHPQFFATDPYYSKYMTSDVSDVGYTYHFQTFDFDRMVQIAVPQRRKEDFSGVREDSCLSCGVEYHDVLKGWLAERETDTPEDGYLQGYSFIIGSDNACYKRKLMLWEETDGEVYEIRIRPQYRPDIEKNVPDQKHVELSGFAVQVPRGSLPPGNYRVGLYAKKRFAKEEIIRWTTCYLKIRQA